MQNNLDKYTQEVKSKIDRNYLSPLFIRLANLLYAMEHFDECITVCKTGLEIYPDYLTAKLILLKAFLKAEYLNEAEILYKELKSKITNKDLLAKFRNSIRTLKTISRQEKIYYPKSVKNKFDYKTFENNFHHQEYLFSDFTLNSFLNNESDNIPDNDKEFQKFLNKFEAFHFENNTEVQQKKNLSFLKNQPALTGSPDDLLYKIKIVTETLADIYSEQGNYKEAFDAYNILLRAGSSNSKRIEEKLNELERNMIK